MIAFLSSSINPGELHIPNAVESQGLAEIYSNEVKTTIIANTRLLLLPLRDWNCRKNLCLCRRSLTTPCLDEEPSWR